MRGGHSPIIYGPGGEAKILAPNGLVSDTAASMVRVHTGNGHGSTNTVIRRFTTAVDNIGSDITYADSATDGGTFTINDSGIYSIVYYDLASAGALVFGLSLKSTQLTTSITSITAADRLGVISTVAAGYASCISWTGYLAATDVIRAHTDGNAGFTNSVFTTLTIARVGVAGA